MATLIQRLVWVVPEDVLVGISAETLASELRQRFSCDTWLLSEGRAMAYSVRGILVNRGMSLDYGKYLEDVRPIHAFCDGLVTADADALAIEIPDTKYWVEVLLQPDEKETRSCIYFKSTWNPPSPLSFRAYTQYKLSPRSRKNVHDYLTNHFETNSHRSINGEILRMKIDRISDYERFRMGYPEYGFDCSCVGYSPVTWPWIELLLDMRRNLEKKHRLSFTFEGS
jgi:hypothetical protein